MKFAIVRTLVISAVTLFLLTTTIFWLRFLGQLQQFSPLEHPLITSEIWLVLKPTDSHPTSQQLTAWLEDFKSTNEFVWLDLRRSQDGEWFVAPLEWVEHPMGRRAVQAMNFAEVQDLWPDKAPLRLNDLWPLVQDKKLWLNVIEKDPYWVNELRDLVPDEMNKKIIVSSPIKQFGKKLREAQPEWLFANDPSTLNQFMMLDSLFLESIGSLWSDIFFAPAEILGRDVFTSRLRAELERRNLPVVLDLSVSSPEKANALLTEASFNLRGLVANSREVLQQAASQIQAR